MYMIKEKEAYLIYQHTTKIDDILTVLTHDISIIYGTKKNRTFFLMHLYVPITMRGKGFGTQLLLEMIEICRINGCRRIDVDDMSDNFRKPNNIYIKNGFVYRNTTGPEMYMLLSTRTAITQNTGSF